MDVSMLRLIFLLSYHIPYFFRCVSFIWRYFWLLEWSVTYCVTRALYIIPRSGCESNQVLRLDRPKLLLFPLRTKWGVTFVQSGICSLNRKFRIGISMRGRQHCKGPSRDPIFPLPQLPDRQKFWWWPFFRNRFLLISVAIVPSDFPRIILPTTYYAAYPINESHNGYYGCIDHSFIRRLSEFNPSLWSCNNY